MQSLSSWLHIALVLVGAIACGVLIVFGRAGGHPPAIVLLPVLLAFWAFGHTLIFAIARTMAKADDSETDIKRPPAGVVVALLVTGALSFIGIVQIGGTLLMLNWYPFAGNLWWNALAVAIIHGVTFIGLLLRRPWSRWLVAALAVFWCAIAIINGLENLSRFRIEQLGEWLVLIGWLSLSALIAFDFTRSRKIARYLGSRQKKSSQTD